MRDAANCLSICFAVRGFVLGMDCSISSCDLTHAASVVIFLQASSSDLSLHKLGHLSQKSDDYASPVVLTSLKWSVQGLPNTPTGSYFCFLFYSHIGFHIKSYAYFMTDDYAH